MKVTFTGDYSELKKLGFSHTRSGGYRWNAGPLTITKKGNEITNAYSGISFAPIVKFILDTGIDNLEWTACGWFEGTEWLNFYIHQEDLTCTTNYTKHVVERKIAQKHGHKKTTFKWRKIAISNKEAVELLELIKRGWVDVE